MEQKNDIKKNNKIEKPKSYSKLKISRQGCIDIELLPIDVVSLEWKGKFSEDALIAKETITKRNFLSKQSPSHQNWKLKMVKFKIRIVGTTYYQICSSFVFHQFQNLKKFK